VHRLAGSGYRFALKRGVLLAAFDDRRPTRDVDLAAIDFDIGRSTSVIHL